MPSILPILGEGIRGSSPPATPYFKIYTFAFSIRSWGKNEIVGHFPIFSTNLHFKSNIFSRHFPNIGRAMQCRMKMEKLTAFCIW